jgi:hypothetical protein
VPDVFRGFPVPFRVNLFQYNNANFSSYHFVLTHSEMRNA